MNDYEFWKEIGKIFNAVVAYQEKSVEFNKQFINPWIRLGNVFDKQDHNTDAINEYQKAVELDPANAQNWYELGNAYFRTEFMMMPIMHTAKHLTSIRIQDGHIATWHLH